MTDEYRRLLDDLAAEHYALDALVVPLADPQWSVATPAEGWTIRDTIAHLAVTDHVAFLAATDTAAFDAYRVNRWATRNRSMRPAECPPRTCSSSGAHIVDACSRAWLGSSPKRASSGLARRWPLCHTLRPG